MLVNFLLPQALQPGPVYQRGSFHAQNGRNLLQRKNADVRFAAFQFAHVSPIHVRLQGQGFTGGTTLQLSPLNSTLDDFRFYNRALSGSDVAALVAIPEPGQTAALFALAGGLVGVVRSLRRRRNAVV